MSNRMRSVAVEMSSANRKEIINVFRDRSSLRAHVRMDRVSQSGLATRFLIDIEEK
jgi:hypothetical protein